MPTQNTYTTTLHGDNIAEQIVGEDAFGRSGPLNPADVYYIIDMLHSNCCDVMEAADLHPEAFVSDVTRMSELLSEVMDKILAEFDLIAP